MLRLRGYVPPAANGKLGSITPFGGGNAALTRVHAPGGQRKIGQHHPLLQGAMLRLRGYMPPEANRNLGSITPFCRGKDAAR